MAGILVEMPLETTPAAASCRWQEATHSGPPVGLQMERKNTDDKLQQCTVSPGWQHDTLHARQPCCALTPRPEEHLDTSHPAVTCTPSATSWPQGSQGQPATSCPSCTAPVPPTCPPAAVSHPQASLAAVQAQEQASLLSQARVPGEHTEAQGAWHSSWVHTTATSMEASVKSPSAPCARAGSIHPYLSGPYLSCSPGTDRLLSPTSIGTADQVARQGFQCPCPPPPPCATTHTPLPTHHRWDACLSMASS
jgi:hypothetical protein